MHACHYFHVHQSRFVMIVSSSALAEGNAILQDQHRHRHCILVVSLSYLVYYLLSQVEAYMVS